MVENSSSYASDTVEAEIDFEDWPEQAQLDHQNRNHWSFRLEIFVTGLVAKYPTFIWWMTVVTCSIPLAVFFAIDAPYLYNWGLPELPLIIVGLFVWATALFLSISFMDPGIIKPYSTEKIMALEQDLQMQQQEDYGKSAFAVQSGVAKPQFVMKRQYTWTVGGQEIITDWCYHCNIFKAPRVHHCKLCGRCIERFDHHCPWLDNCVGVRNYRWFLLLLVSYGVLWISVAVFSIVHIVLRGIFTKREDLGFLVTTIFEVAAAIANLHFLTVLLICQSDLLKLGITVHEFKTDQYFNKTSHKFQSPFNRGSFWTNLGEACLTPWRPSEIIPKSPVAAVPDIPPSITEPLIRKEANLPSAPVPSIDQSLRKTKSRRSSRDRSFTSEEANVTVDVLDRKSQNPFSHLTINVIPTEETVA